MYGGDGQKTRRIAGLLAWSARCAAARERVADPGPFVHLSATRAVAESGEMPRALLLRAFAAPQALMQHSHAGGFQRARSNGKCGAYNFDSVH